MKVVRFTIALSYAGFIFYLSSRPWTGISNLPPYADKIFHFALYFVFGVVVLWALRTTRFRGSRWALVISSLFLLVYGASDEIHQLFVPGRSADYFDWAMDALGGVSGVFFGMGLVLLRGDRKI